jgi:hypothetical protein
LQNPGIVLPDGQGTLMVEQSIQNMSCLAGVSRDYLGVERCKPVGDVGIELYAWLRPVVGVVIAAGLPVGASPEELPVGGGSFAVAPESGKRLSVDRIDQAGESSLVGLSTEVPFGSPKELSIASPHETEKIVRLARDFESKPMFGASFTNLPEP